LSEKKRSKEIKNGAWRITDDRWDGGRRDKYVKAPISCSKGVFVAEEKSMKSRTCVRGTKGRTREKHSRVTCDGRDVSAKEKGRVIWKLWQSGGKRKEKVKRFEKKEATSGRSCFIHLSNNNNRFNRKAKS